MDVTEYDSLRKNVELAEKRAEDLKKAKKEISKLQEEKISALKAAEKQVIYRRESYSEETVRPTRSRMEILNHLERRFGRASGHSGRYGGGPSVYDSYTGTSFSSGGYDPYGISDLADMFFTKDVVKSTPVVESVTTKGLDEVKAELRVELEAKLSEEVTTKLTRLEVVEPQVKELTKQVSELEKTVTTTGDHYTKSANKVLALEKELERTKKLLSLKSYALVDIGDTLGSKTLRWFGSKKKLNKISDSFRDLNKRMQEINEW